MTMATNHNDIIKINDGGGGYGGRTVTVAATAGVMVTVTANGNDNDIGSKDSHNHSFCSNDNTYKSRTISRALDPSSLTRMPTWRWRHELAFQCQPALNGDFLF